MNTEHEEQTLAHRVKDIALDLLAMAIVFVVTLCIFLFILLIYIDVQNLWARMLVRTSPGVIESTLLLDMFLLSILVLSALIAYVFIKGPRG